MRFHSAPVVRLADAKPMQLGHVARADGAWRLYVFADAADRPVLRLRQLCEFLASDASPIAALHAGGADPDTVIDVRAIFQQGHRDLDVGRMPAVLLPRKGSFGLIDYEKVFCPDPAAADIFDVRGRRPRDGLHGGRAPGPVRRPRAAAARPPGACGLLRRFPDRRSVSGGARPAWRSRAWGIVGALSITEVVSWGVLYYAFAAFLLPMRDDLGYSTAQLTGAYSLALAVSAAAGIAVGRYLDRRSPRGLMTLGSVAGVGLVAAWSQVDGLLAFYALWIGIGLVMATVLYEPAFVVLAKHFTAAPERRRAMTALTLVAALASFIFLPLSQALIDAYGWRDALLVLAVILAAVTVPLHALVLRPAPARARAEAAEASAEAGAVLRSLPFWALSTAFLIATLSGVATMLFAIPFLLERGHSASFAAFAVGLVGLSQIPGRLLFAPLAAWLPRPVATASVFLWIAAGIALLVGVDATARRSPGSSCWAWATA